MPSPQDVLATTLVEVHRPSLGVELRLAYALAIGLECRERRASSERDTWRRMADFYVVRALCADLQKYSNYGIIMNGGS